MREIDSKRAKGICVAHGCSNPPGTRDRFCWKHRKRYKKEHNPISYTYQILKGNARRRGKVFNLTIDQFRIFCEKTNYLALKGRSSSSASIDRIDPSKGYEADNIQILSLSDNSKKGDYKEPF